MKGTVRCTAEPGGWSCVVVVGEDRAATQHAVRVTASVLGRLRPGAADPTRLVRDAFDFLLAREPREAILGSFDLAVIGRYFPEWESELAEPPAER
jgi:hypothetical protein